MKTFTQPGRTLTVAAPTGGVVSGEGVLIGALFGMATTDAAEGAGVEILTEGVVEIAKTSALAIDVGDRLFWDGTKGRQQDRDGAGLRRYRSGGCCRPQRHGEDEARRGYAGGDVTAPP
ncbi:MAG: DUF2190 family protein [Allosphingosinicella sp.]